MKLSDLKNGAVVETRDGRRYLKVDKTFLNINGSGNFMPISAYNNDLICQDGTGDNIERSADIVKVNNNTLSNCRYSECCNIPCVEVTRNIWTWERKEVLTEEEQEYLRGVIKPFRDRIVGVKKVSLCGDDCYIDIQLSKTMDSCSLPIFNKNKMYRNMETDRPYTLKELDL